ncbi:MAG: tRNA threonylcarbamoyladenosine dehydratase, partial [Clostridiales bacterium]|nr:tRNA threonylcarbamoyladenosine dehydratase [Clostridiales bacterium]
MDQEKELQRNSSEEDIQDRTRRLIGKSNVMKLRHARVAVFGIGGVGGYALEALARSGIGALDIIDHDLVAKSNINRQILATASTLGQA